MNKQHGTVTRFRASTLKCLLSTVLVAGSPAMIIAQTAGHMAQSPAATLDDTALYILFFGAHAQSANLRATGQGRVLAADLASRVHIQTSEVAALDAAALSFVSQDNALTQEAYQAHQAAKASGGDLTIDAVHSFTLRRTELVNTIVSRLQSQLTPKSFAAFRSYLNSEFRNSIQLIGVRHA